MKKVELLSPAGNYEALSGVINAGADAVYLGGNAFGARAYADNFSQEEICEGISYAHTFHKKIYLTVNTLVKEQELSALYSFLSPLYEAGLDGVIIQDLGVLAFIRKYFPGLELHASTQMTITGSYGASLLKKEGVCRVVPARELSLDELKAMKENTDMEIEIFIHGAMCYCYSGQCLLSSILGGRSGNRGRCAQPCRLPYTLEGAGKKEEYPLSMKDMCTLQLLPELIAAGMDSFKIEGRMKKPEYAAGVTAIYRKYIDSYYEALEKGEKGYRVSPEDMQRLEALYMRSAISEGYYHRHNGREMLTMSSPSYAGSDEKLLQQIREQYLISQKQLPVRMILTLKTGEKAHLTVSCEGYSAACEGDMVSKAQKQPLTKEKITQQLMKTGNTCFVPAALEVHAEDDIFMPVSALNSLRREGLSLLREKIIHGNFPETAGRKALPIEKPAGEKKNLSIREALQESAIHVLVHEREQLLAAIKCGVPRIYIDRLPIDSELLKKIEDAGKKNSTEFYLAFPYIVRKRSYGELEKLFSLLELPVFDGVLVRNLETLAWLSDKKYGKKIVTDINLYAWNRYAYEFLKEKADEIYFPAELNVHDMKELTKSGALEEGEASVMVYGRLPMMVSAGCIRKTKEACSHTSGYDRITDRMQKQFPVYHDCTNCYNIMYNSVPLSGHKLFENRLFVPGKSRLDFTLESGAEAEKVIMYFQKLSEGDYEAPFYKEFTTGHLKRGVE